jgi:uncharacterized protein YbaR (Trm112 family)
VNDRRTATAGKTRTCPHCRATILESSAVCPACRHHLRFDSRKTDERAQRREVAFSAEGSFGHASGPPWEYTIVIVVRNERGDEVARQVVSVGALGAGERRSVGLSVEVLKTGADD